MEDYILRKQEMTVRMTPELLYDFTLYHTYSRFTGFLSIVLAFAVAIIGLIRVFSGTVPPTMMAFYGGAAFLFIAYTPLTLKLRAAKQVQEIDRYREEVHYIFDPAEGITAEYGGRTEFIPWERCEKVVSAPKNIGIYYGKDLAVILPKTQFGDKFQEIMTVIMANVVGKVYEKARVGAETAEAQETAGNGSEAEVPETAGNGSEAEVQEAAGSGSEMKAETVEDTGNASASETK